MTVRAGPHPSATTLMTFRRVPLGSILALPLLLLLGVQACGDDESPSEPGPPEGVVGPDGGTVTLEGGAVMLTFPAGAVSDEIEVSATAASGPASDLAVPGAAFDLGPDGVSFAQPVTLTLSYDEADVPAGVAEADLRPHAVSGGSWVPVEGSSVSVGANTVTGELDSFSVYGVVGLAVDVVSVTPGSATLDVDETVQLAAATTAEGGTQLDRPVEWESSDGSVATVDQAGLVTAVGAGSADITARSDGAEGSATITVRTPVDVVEVSPSEVEIEVDESVELTAIPRAADGTELDRDVSWSSRDEGIATVSDAGVVTGVAAGMTTVDATAVGVTGSADVTVLEPVASVEIDPQGGEIEVDETLQLTATPRAGDGTALDRLVSWESANDDVATVDDTGLVTGRGAGEVEITATSGGASASVTITVVAPVATVEVTAPVQGFVAGGEVEVSVVARDGDGNVIEERPVAFSSSDQGVATVDENGVVSGLEPGVVEITATVDGVSGSVTLTVTLDWTEFEGDWSGEWTNTTFNSSGAITATLTIDLATLTATLVIDVDGFVFGVEDPLPMTVVGEIGATTIEVDHDAGLHGPVQFDLGPGDFSLSSIEVPADGIDAWDYEGTNSATEHSGDFTVHFSSGSTAVGTVTVTKDEGS